MDSNIGQGKQRRLVRVSQETRGLLQKTSERLGILVHFRKVSGKQIGFIHSDLQILSKMSFLLSVSSPPPRRHYHLHVSNERSYIFFLEAPKWLFWMHNKLISGDELNVYE